MAATNLSVRARNLERLLEEAYERSTARFRVFDGRKVSGKPLEEEIESVYEQLGGVQKMPPLPRGREWPMEFVAEGQDLAVMLDEDLDFHRYRAVTLRAPLYKEGFTAFDVEKYRTYCRRYEKETLKGGAIGRNWESKMGERAFGPSSPSGELKAPGPSAWKWRAYCQMLEDCTPRLVPVKLLRLSVWDDALVGGRLQKLKDLLLAPQGGQKDALVKYLTRRVEGALGALS